MSRKNKRYSSDIEKDKLSQDTISSILSSNIKPINMETSSKGEFTLLKENDKTIIESIDKLVLSIATLNDNIDLCKEEIEQLKKENSSLINSNSKIRREMIDEIKTSINKNRISSTNGISSDIKHLQNEMVKNRSEHRAYMQDYIKTISDTNKKDKENTINILKQLDEDNKTQWEYTCDKIYETKDCVDSLKAYAKHKLADTIKENLNIGVIISIATLINIIAFSIML